MYLFKPGIKGGGPAKKKATAEMAHPIVASQALSKVFYKHKAIV